MPVVFQLEQDEIQILTREINGQGGFQTLLRELEENLIAANGKLELSDELLGKTIRYLTYGGGGFQGRLADGIRRNVHDLIHKA